MVWFEWPLFWKKKKRKTLFIIFLCSLDCNAMVSGHEKETWNYNQATPRESKYLARIAAETSQPLEFYKETSKITHL